jgi:copper chaperone CopZ
MEPIRLKIEGRVGGSSEGVENALRTVPGVMSVRADPTGNGVHVEAAEGVKADDLIAAARKAGYITTLAGS